MDIRYCRLSVKFEVYSQVKDLLTISNRNDIQKSMLQVDY